MIKSIIFSVLMFVALTVEAGNHGPCKIQSINQSDSYPNYLLIKMSCQGTSLATTCNNILTDVVTYDAVSEVGKIRTSVLLSAFMAGKDVRVSTWGACPVEISNVPRVYGITVY